MSKIRLGETHTGTSFFIDTKKTGEISFCSLVVSPRSLMLYLLTASRTGNNY